jgi:hypothetical protein
MNQKKPSKKVQTPPVHPPERRGRPREPVEGVRVEPINPPADGGGIKRGGGREKA